MRNERVKVIGKAFGIVPDKVITEMIVINIKYL